MTRLPPELEGARGRRSLTYPFWLQVMAHKLPRPHLEYPFAEEIGRKWRFDLAWPEYRIAVELEGGARFGGRHTHQAGFVEDCHKYAAAAVMGWRVLRGDSSMVQRGYLIQYVMDMLHGNRVPALRKRKGAKTVYERPRPHTLDPDS